MDSPIKSANDCGKEYMADIIIGTILIFFALSTVTWLTLWSRHTIDMISDKDLHSVREIQKELKK